MSGPGPARPPAPPTALLARRRAETSGFAHSSSDEVGRLLRALAAARPHGRVAESGTGFGVGAAWLLDGLGPDGTLVTVERDEPRWRAARELLAGDGRAHVVHGDWRLLQGHGPFDLVFGDGGGKRDAPDDLVALLAPGGVLVLDDFSPSHGWRDGPDWPPRHEGEVDELRLRYLLHPALHAAEVAVSAREAVIVATRRLSSS